MHCQCAPPVLCMQTVASGRCGCVAPLTPTMRTHLWPCCEPPASRGSCPWALAGGRRPGRCVCICQRNVLSFGAPLVLARRAHFLRGSGTACTAPEMPGVGCARQCALSAHGPRADTVGSIPPKLPPSPVASFNGCADSLWLGWLEINLAPAQSSLLSRYDCTVLFLTLVVSPVPP